MLLKQFEPQLHQHLKYLSLEPELVCSDWIDRFFIDVVPLQLALTIFDNYLVNGPKFLFQVAVAMFSAFSTDLISNGQLSDSFLKRLKQLLTNENQIFPIIEVK